MMEASAHRARAREALRGNWANAVLVSVLAGVIAGVGTSPSFKIDFEVDQPVQITVPDEMQTVLHDILGIALPVVLIFSMVMLVVGALLGGVMDLGKARYNLNLIDRTEARIADLFTGFPRFAQALVMNLVRTPLIFLGMVFFIIPGILLRCGFAMAPYILAEDPDCGGWDALRRSWEMMRGHKGELFWLELTFIGWEILASFTFGIGNLFLNPYKDAARASLYRELTARGYGSPEYY